MSNKWRGLHGPITAEAAAAEPLDQQLFGPDFDRRQRQRNARRQSGGINRATYAPWGGKPRIERVKR